MVEKSFFQPFFICYHFENLWKELSNFFKILSKMASDLIFLFKKGNFECFRLLVRLRKLKCNIFFNFEKINFSKTQNFQNSPKIRVFI
jgi:hypothetical protein